MEKTEQRSEAVGLDYLKLVLLCMIKSVQYHLSRQSDAITIAGKVPKREGGLTLNLEAGAVH